jgi:LacI family transcriptional regulator
VETARGEQLDSPMTGTEIIEAERQAFERFAADPDIAGIILWSTGTPENMPVLRALRASGKPLVFVDRMPGGESPKDYPMDYVGVDNIASAKNVVRHLIALGHRRIGHITNNERVNTVWERAEGYRLALEEAGIPFDPALVFPDVFDDVFRNALRDSPNGPITALFAVNDGSAFQAQRAVEEYGLLVPEDISLAGFDGTELLQGRRPFLTTAVQPLSAMGATAAARLLYHLNTPVTPPATELPFRQILLEAPLATHGSTRRVGI